MGVLPVAITSIPQTTYFIGDNLCSTNFETFVAVVKQFSKTAIKYKFL